MSALNAFSEKSKLKKMLSPRRVPFTPLRILILSLLALMMLSGCVSQISNGDGLPSQAHGKMTEVKEPQVSQEKVTVGFFLSNIYDLSTTTNTYYFSGYLWMRWKGDHDPLANLEFTNAVNGAQIVRQPLYPEPITLSNGEKYQVIKLQGRFFEPFDMTNYPLDHQELPLYMENTTDTIDVISYEPDTASSGYDQDIVIPGWNLRGLTSTALVHEYGTDFGMVGEPSASKYSTLKFALHTDRFQNQFYWKLLFPLLIVLATCWLCLVVASDMIHLRTAMPASTLLTTVFLHLASKQEIPQVSFLVLMDKLYMLGYVVIVLTLAQIIWVNSHIDLENKTNLKEMKKVDMIGLATQVVLFTAAVVYLITSVH